MSSVPTSAGRGTSDVVDLALRAGQVLDGKLRVDKVSGDAATGLLVEATHLALEESVAVRFLHRAGRMDPAIVARFLRGVEAATGIANEHVARVIGSGSVDGWPFAIVEALTGVTVEATLVARGPLDVTEAVELAIQACEGLAEAHAQSVVHRRLTPANLLVTERGNSRCVKLIECGFSTTSETKSSIQYLAPELLGTEDEVDGRADIWSLGVVLFELITGEMPFRAASESELRVQIMKEPHRTLRSLQPDTPMGVEEIVDHCLEKDPARRYQTAADLAVALLPFAPKRARPAVERANAIIARASGQPPPYASLPPSASSPIVLRPADSTATLAASSPDRLAPPAPAWSPTTPEWLAIAAVILGLTGAAYSLVAHTQTQAVGAPAASVPRAASTPNAAPATSTSVAAP